MPIPRVLAVSFAVVVAGCATPPEIMRRPLPNSTFPISSSVEVKGDVSTIYLSGQVPPNVDPTPAPDRPPVYGRDTEAQATAILQNIAKTLDGIGLTMGDVVKMQVFLVGDPALGGKMDNAGFSRAYTQFFGTAAQPNTPARSVFQIVALSNPAWMLEIEVVAVRRRP